MLPLAINWAQGLWAPCCLITKNILYLFSVPKKDTYLGSAANKTYNLTYTLMIFLSHNFTPLLKYYVLKDKVKKNKCIWGLL